ncbi:hypothetical protein CPC08DRAFT_755631 [Agrocybe pediades]|nr:hypothetical protein CPC08DRAFT_755631 [Agrocybe pediades]
MLDNLSRFEPELYRIVKRTGLHQCPPDLNIKVYKPAPGGQWIIKTGKLDKSRILCFGQWVQHFFFNRRQDELKLFLQHCPNVYDLELGEYTNRNCVNLIPLLEKLPLRRLCFNPCSFFETRTPYKRKSPYAGPLIIPFDQPMFHGLTHLEIILHELDRVKANYGQLTLLPRLTHLAFTGGYWDTHLEVDKLINSILQHDGQRIQLLVVIFEHEFDFKTMVPESQHRNNARVVFLPDAYDDELDRDRGQGKRTEKAFWRVAEAKKQEALEKATVQ